MLPPLDALSLASNIVQILSFGAQIASEATKATRSGDETLPSNSILSLYVNRTQDLAGRIQSLRAAPRPLSHAETLAYDTAQQCCEETAKAITDLNKLKVRRSDSGTRTWLRALQKSARATTVRESLQSRLETLHKIESQLGNALLRLILENQQSHMKDLQKWIENNNNDKPDVTQITASKDAMLNIINRQSDEIKAKGDRILRSLAYHEMEYRRQAIPEAFRKTFEWCFESKASPFPEWLERSNGLFWICGRAGSGKSTLMKFLTDDPRTKDTLKQWAEGRKLLIADHYFWYAGSPMQKSHNGLLQSILHQLLKYDLDLRLTPVLCRTRWSDVDDTRPWARHELIAALRAFEDCQDSAACIFIDGLDEYHPHEAHRDLINDLISISETSNIKLCVSSRPWTAFDEAFSPYPRINLEDLTKEDIAHYVQQNLTGVDRTHRLSRKALNSHDASKLTAQIVQKAQGVFLWVHLVVAALQARLSLRTSMPELLKCIEDFPDELEEYFRMKIYNRIHKSLLSDTCQALKLAMRITWQSNQQRHDSLADRALLRSILPFWVLKEGMEGPEFAASRELQRISLSEAEIEFTQTKDYLNACCKDLLVVTQTPRTSARHGNHPAHYYRVEFLHRTVYDFLSSEEMQVPLNKYSPPHFHDQHFLTHVTCAYLKLLFVDTGDICQEFQGSIHAIIKDPITFIDPKVQHLFNQLDSVGCAYARETCDRSCGGSQGESAEALLDFFQLNAFTGYRSQFRDRQEITF